MSSGQRRVAREQVFGANVCVVGGASPAWAWNDNGSRGVLLPNFPKGYRFVSELAWMNVCDYGMRTARAESSEGKQQQPGRTKVVRERARHGAEGGVGGVDLERY